MMNDFKLNPLFTDYAVLARNKEIRVFGTACPGMRLHAKLTDSMGRLLAEDTAVTDGTGTFIAYLPPQEVNTRCTLCVSDGVNEKICCDVCIGDVYLAAGQSNMELELRNSDDGDALLKKHENPLVRYYNVPKYAVLSEEAEEANMQTRWQRVLPGTGQDMSAAAYHFAMLLSAQINVPIGIIDCYWGGTSVSCWMREETLRSITEGVRYLDEYSAKCAGKTEEQYLEEEKVFYADMAAWDRKAADLRQSRPDITSQELNRILGPYPWKPPVGPLSPYRPAGLAYTMMERVEPATLTGVLYYQGEEDTARTDRYDILLSAFFGQLRKRFRNPLLPILNVQLPMWIEAGAKDSFLWPRLRMAQQSVCDNMRNTDLAVLIDQGEYDNIHPTNKRVVGERLYYCALRTVYHQPAPQSPYPVDAYIRDGQLFVVLNEAITAPEDLAEPLMEVAAVDGEYVPAKVIIRDDTLVLRADGIERPVKARYAWTDYAKAPFFGVNGLPLRPFVIE